MPKRRRRTRAVAYRAVAYEDGIMRERCYTYEGGAVRGRWHTGAIPCERERCYTYEGGAVQGGPERCHKHTNISTSPRPVQTYYNSVYCMHTKRGQGEWVYTCSSVQRKKRGLHVDLL